MEENLQEAFPSLSDGLDAEQVALPMEKMKDKSNDEVSVTIGQATDEETKDGMATEFTEDNNEEKRTEGAGNNGTKSPLLADKTQLLNERNLKGKVSSRSFLKCLFRLFRYASLLDWIVMFFGSIMSVLNGSVLAVSLLVLAMMVDAFVSIAASTRFVNDTGTSFVFLDLVSEEAYQLLGNPIPYSTISDLEVVIDIQAITNGVIDCQGIIPIAFTGLLDGIVVNITMESFLGGLFSYYTCFDNTGFIAEVNKLIYILAAISGGSLIFGSLLSLSFQWVSNRMVKRLRLDLYRAILRQDQSWFDSMDNSAAVLSAKLTKDMDTLQTGIGRNLGNMVSWIATFLVSLLVSFLGSTTLTLVVLSPVPIIVISSLVLNTFTTMFTSYERKHYNDAGGVAEEVLSSIKTVVGLGGEYKELDRYKIRLDKAKKIGTRIGLYQGISYFLIYFFLFFAVAIAVWYASYLSADRLINASQVLQVLFAIMIGAFFLSQSTTNFGRLNIAASTADSSIDIINHKPTISSTALGSEEEGGIIPDSNFEFSIEFKDVHFSYPTRPNDKILNGFNLYIKNGQRVALLGESGSGKSTLLALLQRLYDVDNGLILINGIDITKLNLHWLRSQIGTVLQEPALFDTTIKENILFGKLDATKEQVTQAAKNANIHEAIKDLPKSYNSSVGEHGGLLSGGQKQRIAIARAFLRDPSLLLLDEATSALDVENEALLEETITSSSKTVLIVTHRLPLVRSVHVVIQIEAGHVSWSGTPDEFMALKRVDDHKEDEDCFIVEKSSICRARRSATGRRTSRKTSRESNILSRRNTVYDLEKNESAEMEPTVNQYSRLTIVKRLLQLNKSEWYIILLSILSAAIAGSGFPIFGLLFGITYDTFVSSGPQTIVNDTEPWGAAYVALGIMMGIAYFTKTLTLAVNNERLTRRARLRTFKAILRQDMEWFDEDNNNTGSLTSLLSDDSRNIQGVGATLVAVLWEAGVSLLLAYAVGFYTNWSLTLVMLLFVPIYLFSIIGASKVSIQVVLRHLSSLVKANTTAIESIENIQTVKSLQLENIFLKKYGDNVGKQDRWSLLISPLHPLPTTVIVLGMIISFRYGAYQVLVEGTLMTDIELILRTFVALVFSTVSVGVLLEQQGELYQAGKLSSKKIFNVLDRKPKLDNLSTEGITKDDFKGQIELKDIIFSYPTREEVKVLKCFSVSVPSANTLALIGPSGSGKSTIISLLERFYSPEAGRVLLDDCDIGSFNVRWLRSKIGIVSQEPVLFDLTIAENIRYGSWDKDITEEDVINAAKAANIHDFITSTTQGYETKIGPKGSLLSGGQKQRIAIARAIIQNPAILLLDEATSALDEHTAELVEEALEKVKRGRTTILITHQLGTLQRADKIVVIKRGKLVEEGNPKELLEKRGYYYKMIHMQFF